MHGGGSYNTIQVAACTRAERIDGTRRDAGRASKVGDESRTAAEGTCGLASSGTIAVPCFKECFRERLLLLADRRSAGRAARAGRPPPGGSHRGDAGLVAGPADVGAGPP